MEKSGGSRTLGRVFGYLLLADKPRTLDQIANDLLFSKATASLTVRQGLLLHFFEKVSIPGERKDYYRANIQSWINAASDHIKVLSVWDALIDRGLELLHPDNRAALENLKDMKDYFTFYRWYLSDFEEQYKLWKKGEIRMDLEGGKL
ncbi:MAG: GbsR/MarR family transcriptional regulator [Bacillota bacterium]